MPKTHYTLVEEEHQCMVHQGQATEAPAVGDSILVDGAIYVVRRRTWRTAAEIMSSDEARHRSHADNDIVHVSLGVELVATAAEPCDLK